MYDIDREAAKISVLSAGKIGKCECLTGEDISPCNQEKIIEQVKFTYSALGKAFQKQTKAIETEIIKYKKKNKSKQLSLVQMSAKNNLYANKFFNELFHKTMGEKHDLSRQIDLNNLTYNFVSPNLVLRIH